jgi:hypothetical protein
MLMIPIEATSVLGALGGIGEIARATFGGGTPTMPPARPGPTGPATAARPSS